ncbi:MAG TPA: hypothetical protein PKX15_09080 [Bacteroidales bacterium]|nr:hypothetical protein [Bacteroidales bacterium]
MRTYTEKEAKQSYLPPCIELTEILVEKGFASSLQSSPSAKAAGWSDGIEEEEWD